MFWYFGLENMVIMFTPDYSTLYFPKIVLQIL